MKIVKAPKNGIPNYRFPDHIKNDTFDGIEFQILGLLDGLPVDITDTAIQMDFKLTKTSSAALTFSTTNGLISITSGSDGEFKINSSIVTIDAGVYLYDAEFTYPNTEVKTYFDGNWVIVQDITNG